MLKVASVSIAFGLVLSGLLSSCAATTSTTPIASPTESSPAPIASAPPSAQPPAQTEEPNQDNLTMTCRGTIEDAVDYTAFFDRGSGFNRVEFRPRTSTTKLTATMTYSDKNAQGQNTWRGSVNNAADVVLVHLSDSPVQLGDEISVTYDGRSGQATCR